MINTFFVEDTDAFLLAYKDVEECFAKTGLFKESVKSLEDNGIAILIGPQGSGKTFNAAYIMSKTYESWTKTKFTSWEDLLTMALEKNTLVYIDNLLDGYMYQHELRKWWCSLCYFYFERIQPEKNIRLLITGKDNVIKEACDHIGANIFEMIFYLNMDSFPLTHDERKDILKLQFQLAEKMMGIKTPEISSTYEDIKDKYSSIGFPLCAHLYAFEKDIRTTDIFDDPRTYVIRHIKNEIDNDDTHGVKTLFLFLLFYTSPSSLKPNKILDPKYGKDIREYLEDPRVAPKDLVNKMEPLNFENLPNIAKSLRYTILIKQSSMYEFKHQIYLDGASDYFFRKHAQVAVHYFPLDILRLYAFPDAPKYVWREIIKRFTSELLESIKIEETELKNRACKNRIPEILSCKIFEKVQFEIEFCEELKQSTLLNKLLFHKELCFTFWTSMFGRRELTEIASCIDEEHSDYQFYKSRYGECCEKEKIYLDDDTATMDLKTLKRKVWDFKSSDGKSILHLVLCSDRSDYEAHCIITRLFNDTNWDNVFQNNDLLNCALEQTRRSRIVCILEILRKQNETISGRTKADISSVIAQIKVCGVNDIHLDLEFVVRICIIVANNESPTKTVNLDFNTNKESFKYVTALLRGKLNSQSTMRKIIEDCIKNCPSSELPAIKPKSIPYTDIIGSELKQAIRDSVQVLSCKDKLGLVSMPV